VIGRIEERKLVVEPFLYLANFLGGVVKVIGEYGEAHLEFYSGLMSTLLGINSKLLDRLNVDPDMVLNS
jgi:hypothetical protein